MRKIFVLSLIMLIIIFSVGCTNNSTNDSTETPQNEIILTTSNISSYLEIEVIDDSDVYLDRSFVGFGRRTGWMEGAFEINTFSKKRGYFENVRLVIEYEPDEPWEIASSEEIDNNFSLTIPVNGEITRTFNVHNVKISKDGTSRSEPSINIKITSVSGTFVEE